MLWQCSEHPDSVNTYREQQLQYWLKCSFLVYEWVPELQITQVRWIPAYLLHKYLSVKEAVPDLWSNLFYNGLALQGALEELACKSEFALESFFRASGGLIILAYPTLFAQVTVIQ